MINRIEQKIEFKSSEYSYFIKWIKSKNASILYPDRKVCSRYFDNSNMQMYRDTLEGLVPRKKIRIRTYNTEQFDFSKYPYRLEIKTTTEYKRSKKILEDFDLKDLMINGFFDQSYGFCKHKIDISYLREYFIIKDIRITIDKNIKYKISDIMSPFIGKEKKDSNYVLEIKTNSQKSLTYLSNIFDFPRTRFSKYERANNSLF